MVYYFAYGFNMDVESMKRRGIVFKKVVKGVLWGYVLKFNTNLPDDWKKGFGFANIMPDENSAVEGVVYETDENSMAKLDYHEDYPSHYDKKNVEVETEIGKIKCIAYVASPETINETLKPKKEYLKHLLAGKKFLSKQYYNFLKNTETFD